MANRGWVVVSPDGANRPFADASARFLMSSISPVYRRAMAMRGLGEVISSDSDY